jgi:hypothetical protein
MEKKRKNIKLKKLPLSNQIAWAIVLMSNVVKKSAV